MHYFRAIINIYIIMWLLLFYRHVNVCTNDNGVTLYAHLVIDWFAYQLTGRHAATTYWHYFVALGLMANLKIC